MTLRPRDTIFDPASPTLPSWRAALALAALAVLPVLYFRVRLPSATDLAVHLAMADQFARGVAQGHWYPRWYGDFNLGWGGPTGYFYPPALSALTAFFTWIAGGRLMAGLMVALGVFSFIGACGVYPLARALRAGRYAWLAVGLWLVTPFRAFELYSAGLFSSLAAGGLAPWVLFALHRLEVAPPSEKARAVSLFALAYGLLALVNLPYVVMVTYLVAAWVVIRSVLRAELSGSLRIVAGGVLGAAIAGVFLLPMLAHLPQMSIPQQAGGEWWSLNFLFDDDAILMPRLRRTLEDAALLPVSGLLISLVMLGVLRKSGSTERIEASAGPAVTEPETSAARWRSASSGVPLLVTFGVLSLVLATPLSTVIWAIFPVLHEAELPWRFLEVTAVPWAVLTAVTVRAVVSAASHVRPSPGRRSDLALMVLAGGLIIVGVLTGVSFGSIARMTPAVEAFHSGELSGTALAQTFHARQSFFLPNTGVDPTTLPDQPLVLPLTPGCRVSTGAG
ncbi:MAG: hypothetical protein IID07_05880 [Gemmatimonadetes bacterium]|nr:hypothetical protein [Gemmatimonadota bacterium]